MFDTADYQRAAARPGVPVANIMAMAAVESSGETFWVLDGNLVVPVHFEAHWFGKLTGYRFNASHPDLSRTVWSPALAAAAAGGTVVARPAFRRRSRTTSASVPARARPSIMTADAGPVPPRVPHLDPELDPTKRRTLTNGGRTATT